MAEHTLSREIKIGLPRERVFDFFADAGNLERITPPELQFRILTEQPFTIKRGTLIDYKLRLRGLPIRWRTEIFLWEPPYRFTDQQLSGPYKQWIHTHTFTEISENRTLIEDEVRYRLPLEPLGDAAHFIVRHELAYIFDFRQKAVAQILGQEIGHSPQ